MIGSRARAGLVVVMLAVVAGSFFASAGSALAHPLGNFTINRYARLEVYRDTVRVHYVVDFAEIPTFQALGEIDSDSDGQTTEAELDAFATSLETSIPLKFDLTAGGRPVDVQPLESSIQLLPGQGGLQILRLVVVYDAPLTGSSGEVAEIAFADSNYADRVGWKEIVIKPGEGADVTVNPDFLLDRSDALRAYPAQSLQSAPDMRSATFTYVTGTGILAPAAAGAQRAETGRSSSGFDALIAKDTSSAWIILFSLLAAFGFGMIHALGPGHGKTVVAAYLVGSKGTVRHAVALGATVTATHTSTVYVVGFIALAASSEFATEKVQLYIGVAAGVMIIVMGLSLFLNRLWRYLRPTADSGVHRHGPFGKAHSHLPAEVHGHSANGYKPERQRVMSSQLLQGDGAAAMTWTGERAVAQRRVEGQAAAGHAHDDHHDHDHDHDHELIGEPAQEHAGVSWKSLITLGIAGGMLPCPSAVVVMISAIALGKVLYGMMLIVAFSIGLASVLTAIGIALVLGKRFSNRSGLARRLEHPVLARLASALPVLSAGAVTVAGIGVTLIAVNQAQIL